jgi:hypothetical protein
MNPNKTKTHNHRQRHLAQQSSISGGFTAMFQDLLPPQKKNDLNTKTITNVKNPMV